MRLGGRALAVVTEAVRGRSDKAVGEAFVAPARVLMFLAIAFPTVLILYMSVTSWTPGTGDQWWEAGRYWVGLDNFQDLLTSDSFYHALFRTLVVVVVAVTVESLLGFGLAMLFVRAFPMRSVFTLMFLLPMMVVPAVAGFIFVMLFQLNGPVNHILSAVLPGDVAIRWLTDPGVALYSVIIVDIWQWTPLMFLIFLSGLVSLPDDQLNAAKLLGARPWFQLRTLVLPMMKPIILIAVIIRAVETFKIFDPAWILTKGGPGEASTTISVFFYRATFVESRCAYASAAAIIVVSAVSLVAWRAIRPIEGATEEALDESIVGEGPRPVVAVAGEGR